MSVLGKLINTELIPISLLQSTENTERIEVWKQKDVEARTLIYSTMKLEKQAALQGCKTAAEMWGQIATEYAQISIESEPLLWGQFYSYRLQSGMMEKTRKAIHSYMLKQYLLHRSTYHEFHNWSATNCSPTERDWSHG